MRNFDDNDLIIKGLCEFPESGEVAIEKVEITYMQPTDNCDENYYDSQSITLASEDAGGGPFIRISIPDDKFWSIDEEEELIKIIEDFKMRSGMINNNEPVDIKPVGKFNVKVWNFDSEWLDNYDVIKPLLKVNNESERPFTKHNINNIEEVKDFIIDKSKYLWDNHSEYELSVSPFPNPSDIAFKMSIYDQVIANIDMITNIFIDSIMNG